MRFQVSQSTPSFLSRQFQLRMLSFVGLISVVMITLSVINVRNRSGNDEGSQQSTASPDSLTFDVDRGPALKADEILVVSGDYGIRGQFPDAADDNSRELFKSRKQERSGDSQLFPKRARTPNARADEGPFPDDGPITGNAKPDSTRWINRRDRELPPESAPRNDDWDSQNIVAPRPRDRDISDTPSSNPLVDDLPPVLRNGNGGVPNIDFDEDPPYQPQDKVPARNRRLDPAPGDDNSGRAPRNPYRDSVPEVGFGTGRDPLGSGLGNSPVDRRRSYQDSVDDQQPFKEDFASVRIDKSYLDVVKDNTLGITRDESEVFYWLLDHARRVSSSSLERAGNNEVQYINLMTEPDRFRGEPITIEGDLWRLYEFDAGRNDYGVSRMYEGWVFTGDSGNHPYRVICTSLPKEIIPGENLRKPVRITGYFFKREGYATTTGVRVAPALIARRIGINPSPNGIPLSAGIVPYLVGAMMAIGLALLVTIVGFAISDERSTRTGLQRIRHLPQVSFAELAIPEPVPIEQTLRQLAAHQREATVSGAYGPLLNRQTAREHAVHDYAASRQLIVEEKLRLQKRQTSAVHDWAARQAAGQSELDAMRAVQESKSQSATVERDELGSSQLEPARNVVPRMAEPIAPAPVSPTMILTSPMYAPATISPVPGTHLVIPAIPVMVANPQPVMSQLHSAATPMVSPSNISYRASKLSEWEEEVTRLSNRPGARPYPNQIGSTTNPIGPTKSAEQIAADQIERDRLAREQEIRNKIHQAESERLHREQLERERVEHERDRQRHESHERSHRDHDEGMTFTLSSTQAELERREQELHEREKLEREHLERENRERERYERELHQHDRQSGPHSSAHEESSVDDEYEDVHDSYQSSGDEDGGSSSDHQRRSGRAPSDNSANLGRFQSKSGSQSGWGRSRKRRRNWRDGGST